jgi:WD40 repeat protein
MDQSTFAAGTDDGTVEIYRFNPDEIKLKLTTTLDQHDRIVSSVAAKQENVLSASHDGLIHLWSISSSTPSCVKATFRQHHDVVQDVCWFDQEESFVSVGRDGQGLIWDTRTQSKSSFMNDNSDGILCAKVCNNFIAVGMESGRVEIRDRRSTKIPIYADVSSHRLPVSSVLIIMREETLLVASASDDTSVRVRTMNEKDEKKIDFTYKGHNDYVRALEFGPPGCVFSGGRDQLLHCWTYLLPVAVTK